MAGDGDVLRILAGGEWARKLKWPPRGPPTTSWDGVQEVENGRVTKLWLFNKGLTGEIPKELGDLANLQKLDLSYNKLTGSIPRELGQLQELHHLWLYGNQLTGSIPKELGELRNLQDLYLYNNQLEGSIPTELGQLQKLANLNLSNNQLTDNPGDLSGREAVARWQDSLASRRQQMDADRRRSEQAAEALRLQQEADRLRESRAAAAAAAEAERVAREAAEAEEARERLVRQDAEAKAWEAELEAGRRPLVPPQLLPSALPPVDLDKLQQSFAFRDVQQADLAHLSELLKGNGVSEDDWRLSMSRLQCLASLEDDALQALAALGNDASARKLMKRLQKDAQGMLDMMTQHASAVS